MCKEIKRFLHRIWGESQGEEKRWSGSRHTLGHIPAVVICDRSKGNWEPLAATLIREGQELDRATDRKLPQHITILMWAGNAWATGLKDAQFLWLENGSIQNIWRMECQIWGIFRGGASKNEVLKKNSKSILTVFLFQKGQQMYSTTSDKLFKHKEAEDRKTTINNGAHSKAYCVRGRWRVHSGVISSHKHDLCWMKLDGFLFTFL